ncbi:PAS domain S-box protein [Wenzhouxiangella sp. XN79A]|uniref:sensor domain-containing protein n=1 Tax=Wenzhouxiangella sp. XN79A TaxID=2724193 RepID=UPI00144AB5F2|nr:PAS domain S-box protein [Wenzhouxiangella sp. XN79A]NKI34769.1 PAS domain S-box protein [Wenzhouxiangella sp. XN79A]
MERRIREPPWSGFETVAEHDVDLAPGPEPALQLQARAVGDAGIPLAQGSAQHKPGGRARTATAVECVPRDRGCRTGGNRHGEGDREKQQVRDPASQVRVPDWVLSGRTQPALPSSHSMEPDCGSDRNPLGREHDRSDIPGTECRRKATRATRGRPGAIGLSLLQWAGAVPIEGRTSLDELTATGRPGIWTPTPGYASLDRRHPPARLRGQLISDIHALLLHHAPVAVFWTREDGTFAYVNKQAADYLGYTREELLETPLVDIDLDIDPDFWRQHWADSRSRTSLTLERVHRRKDGTLIPVEVLVRAIEFDDELINASFVRDLTEQRRREALQKQEAENLYALFDRSPAPQLIIDPESGAIVDANPAAQSLYGYNLETFRRLYIQQINQWPEHEVRNAMQQALTGHRNAFEFQHRTATGRVLDVCVYSGRIRREGKSLLHSTIQDITELRDINRKLERDRVQFEKLPVGVYTATPGEDGCFLHANAALARMLGASSPEQLTGIPVASVYQDPQQRVRFSERLLEAGELRQTELAARTLSGRSIWLSVSAHVIEDEQQGILFEGAVEDITARRAAEQEAEAQRSRLFSAIDAAPYPTMLHDREGRVLLLNRAWTELSGYGPEQLPTVRAWTRLAYPDNHEQVRAAIAELFEHGDRRDEGEFEIRCADGSRRTWWFSSAPLQGLDDGPPELVISTAVDVTEVKRHQQRMREADAIVENAGEGITVTDSALAITRVNQAFTNITGYTEAEVLGKNPNLLSSGRQDAGFYQAMWDTIHSTGRWHGEIWNRRKSGEIYPEWLSISSIKDEDGRVLNYVGIFSDLTELKNSRNLVRELQHVDALTRLPNRKQLMQRIHDLVSEIDDQKECIELTVVGLDDFRLINESYSPLIGDSLLKTIAGRFRQAIGQSGEVFRVSGDVFVILRRTEGELHDPKQVFQLLAGSVRGRVPVSRTSSVKVGFSAGSAVFPDDASSPESLLKHAETAMFHAKTSARGTLAAYSSSMTESAQQHLTINNELERAIEQGQVSAHLQPIARVEDDRIVALEILARWHHPTRGFIPPDVFIPIAEQTGLIDALSLYVLDDACRIASTLHRTIDPSIRIAFNVSAVQLKNPAFLGQLLDKLAKHSIDRELFELELTESVLMEQGTSFDHFIDQIQEQSVRLSIDDFGTGFSSLAYLQELDPQVLKVDRRFMSAAVESRKGAALAASIISMAQTLGIEVVAEGVETAAQLQFLRERHCNFYQGYHLARPMGGDDILRFFEQRATRSN